MREEGGRRHRERTGERRKEVSRDEGGGGEGEGEEKVVMGGWR